MTGHPLYAITRHDGAVLVGSYATPAARNRVLRDEQERQETLGAGDVLYVTEAQYASLWDELQRQALDGSSDLFALAMQAINRVGTLELQLELAEEELTRCRARAAQLAQLTLFGGATDTQPVAMSTNARTKG